MKTLHESHLQSALLVSLPHQNSDWKPYLDEISHSYTNFIEAVSKFQKVIAIAPSKSDFERICKNLQNVDFIQIDTNDTWIRDYGAIDVVKNDEIIAYDFTFNAWGGKFQSNKDDALNEQLYKNFTTPLVKQNLILEGGSIEFDGLGTMLTTEHCLLNDNRNSLSKAELEIRLKKIFGLKRICWLKNGFIKGDDTDSHIDTLARFITPSLVAISTCDDENDEHYKPLQAMKEEILNFGFEILELPIPKPIFFENRRLPATYANFVFINNAIIVPTYNDENDKIVLERIGNACPNHQIIGVDSRIFIRQNGSLHCSCMNKFKI